VLQIKSGLRDREGKALTNFQRALLFCDVRLHGYFVIELKIGKLKPE